MKCSTAGAMLLTAAVVFSCKPSPEPVQVEARAPAVPVQPAWASDDDELTLLNLYDSFGRNRDGMTQDFGFSAIVRYGGKTILFDGGTRADLFASNLKALGIAPQEIDYAVASHSHHDHIAGFDYLVRENPDVKLFLPTDFFGLGGPLPFSVAGVEPDAGKALPPENCYFDCQKTKVQIESTGRFWGADVTWVSEPTEIIPGVRLVPTKSDLMGTFVRYPPHGQEPLLIPMPELSMSITTAKGAVVLVGCSHASIEVTLDAVKATGDTIHLVAGGFHLLPYSREEIEKTARYLKQELGVEAVAPAHCTGHVGFDVFRQIYGAAYRFFGLGTKLVV